MFSGPASEICKNLTHNVGGIVDLWDTTEPAHGMNGTEYGDFKYMRRITEVISSHNASVPLFIYYPMQTCHAPEEAPDAYVEPYLKIPQLLVPEYNGMVAFVDEAVKNITDLLKARSMWDNTFYVFQSDNGAPPSNGNAWPLRGAKFSNWVTPFIGISARISLVVL